MTPSNWPRPQLAAESIAVVSPICTSQGASAGVAAAALKEVRADETARATIDTSIDTFAGDIFAVGFDIAISGVYRNRDAKCDRAVTKRHCDVPAARLA
jgi:hypothetical protein